MDLIFAVTFLSFELTFAFGPIGRFGQRGLGTSPKGLQNTRYTSRKGLDTHGFPTFPVNPGRGRGNPPSRGNDRSGERRGSVLPFTVPFGRTTAFRNRGTAGDKKLIPRSTPRTQRNKVTTYSPHTKRKVVTVSVSRSLTPRGSSGTLSVRTSTMSATTSNTAYKPQRIATATPLTNKRIKFNPKSKSSRIATSISSTKLMKHGKTTRKPQLTSPYVSIDTNCTAQDTNRPCLTSSKCLKTSICGMRQAFKNAAKTNTQVVFITILVCFGIICFIVVRRVRESRKFQIFSIARVI